ncbi:MAG: sigma-70 family RNA polymerase sigma factor [Bradyrhizobium sp.]|nr:sigma-70 family RNA polymerase sigma factor [Bradyrhizobium sp.]
MQNSDVSVEIYIEHRGALVNYATTITGERARAEDVVQEAFLRVRSAARAQQLDDPVAYFYRVVRNLALDLRRRLTFERVHVFGHPEPSGQPLDLEFSAEEAAIARERLRNVMEALHELPERTRIALEMHRFGGCTLKQIAEHLGLSIS